MPATALLVTPEKLFEDSQDEPQDTDTFWREPAQEIWKTTPRAGGPRLP